MKGGKRQVCRDVCSGLNVVGHSVYNCNSEKQSTITTMRLVYNAFLDAGYTCPRTSTHHKYAGTPGEHQGDCFWLTSGATSSCTANAHGHSPLCYCDKSNCR